MTMRIPHAPSHLLPCARVDMFAAHKQPAEDAVAACADELDCSSYIPLHVAGSTCCACGVVLRTSTTDNCLVFAQLFWLLASHFVEGCWYYCTATIVVVQHFGPAFYTVLRSY